MGTLEGGANPTVPNLVGDDSADGEILGEQESLKMDEGGPAPPPGSLDYAYPDTSPTEDPRSDPSLDRDPGRLAGSRDPSVAHSLERSAGPDDGHGNTPYDAEGTMGSEGR